MTRRAFISALPLFAFRSEKKPVEVTIQRISLDSWRVWRFEKGQLVVDACQTLGDAMNVARRVLVEDLA